ncbi:MAG TPA: OsmC family peroxiredoxin [Polyangiaceae bacterium]|jgi:osmotically inducible protein OsmC|nr:OsmC family peroxiredoxin [Polyangiaceae bacterium]
MAISKASAQWEGSLREGKGAMKPEHAPEAPFSISSRFEGGKGSNPEELLGAALAGCFSMALTASLNKEKLSPRAVRTSATVHLDKEGDAFKISAIELTTSVEIEGLADEKFQAIAQETKKQCPVSKALAGTTITLKASLG